MLALEVLLRKLVGKMKPITFAHTLPGAIGNQVILPLAVLRRERPRPTAMTG